MRAGTRCRSACEELARRDARREPDHVALQMVGHERQRDQHGNEDRQDLGHESERHFLDLSQAWNSEMMTPTMSPISNSGLETITSVRIASRATSSTSDPVIAPASVSSPRKHQAMHTPD